MTVRTLNHYLSWTLLRQQKMNKTLMKHPPTKRPGIISICMERPPNVLSAVPLYYYDISTPCTTFYDWYISSLEVYYRDISSPWQFTLNTPSPRCFTTAMFCPKKFLYCKILPDNVLVLQHFGPYLLCPANWGPSCFSSGCHVTVLGRDLFIFTWNVTSS